MSRFLCPGIAPTASIVSTSVLEAAAAGDVATLKGILGKGGNPNARDSKGVPALHLAAAGGNVQTVGALLEGGAHVNVVGPGLVTALHVAVANGHVDVVRCLLQKGTNNKIRGRVEGFRRLPQESADYKKCDAQGNTPLMLAVKGKQWAIVCLLVEHGDDPIYTIVEGKSALTVAAAEGEVESVLVMCRAIVWHNYSHSILTTALSHVKNATVLWTFEDVFPEIIKQEGDDALIEAASDGRHEAVEVLLDAGVAINGGDVLGRTPLMSASENGHTECVRKLLQRGARIDADDLCTKNTALHWAAMNGREDVVRELLRAGANATLKNKEGKTALDVAKSLAVKNIISYQPTLRLKTEY